MIVYIESNFVLELTFEQEQAASATAILALAESKEIKLVFPSFVLSEPFEAVARERRERNKLYTELVTTLRKLQRSDAFKEATISLIAAASILGDVYDRQIGLLHATFDKLLDVGECIEINIINFREAVKYQTTTELFPQDSIIYAAIIDDLKTRSNEEKKCFLSRDEKGFERLDIKQELRTYNCRYIGNFNDGLQFIKNSIEKAQ